MESHSAAQGRIAMGVSANALMVSPGVIRGVRVASSRIAIEHPAASRFNLYDGFTWVGYRVRALKRVNQM